VRQPTRAFAFDDNGTYAATEAERGRLGVAPGGCHARFLVSPRGLLTAIVAVIGLLLVWQIWPYA
jgi:hypothetical protein